MTDKENEENGNSSNSKTPDIKNTSLEEQEQDINLQMPTSTSQEQKIEIVPTNEELVRSPKRSRITKSDEAESSKKNQQEESDGDYSDDSTFNYAGQDPLLVTEEVILRYYHFIVYLHQILKNDEEKQDWSIDIVDRVDTLVMNLGRRLRVVTIDMEAIEAAEGMENEYAFRRASILNVLELLLQINTDIASSNCFRLVSDIKNRGKLLPICLGQFEIRRQELNLLMDQMQTLKKMASLIDRHDDT